MFKHDHHKHQHSSERLLLTLLLEYKSSNIGSYHNIIYGNSCNKYNINIKQAFFLLFSMIMVVTYGIWRKV